MLELDFKELETFKTPDGQEYVINPLPVKDIKLIFEFVNMNEKLQKLQKKKDTNRANRVIFGAKGSKEPSLIELASEIVSKAILNSETGEPLPKKYHTVKKLILLSGFVASASMEVNDSDIEKVGGNPLELQKMLSGKSKGTSTL